jgi:hypothetical protein
VKGFGLRNWLRARPWRVYPLSRSGWRYHSLFEAYRVEGCNRTRSAWLALCFPHAHDDHEDQMRTDRERHV